MKNHISFPYRGIFLMECCAGQWVPCTIRVQRGDFSRQLQMTGYAAIHVAVIHASIKVRHVILLMCSCIIRIFILNCPVFW